MHIESWISTQKKGENVMHLAVEVWIMDGFIQYGNA